MDTGGSRCASNELTPSDTSRSVGRQELDKTLDESPGTLVEWTLDPSADGGTLLHLRESGFTTSTSRLENVGGWVEELAELMDHLAVEPWEAPIRRVLSSLLVPGARLESAHGSALTLCVVGLAHGAGRRKSNGGVVRLSRARPVRRSSRSRRARALLRLDLVRGSQGNASGRRRRGTPHRVASQPRKDGGTDLHLVESGFRGPDSRKDNTLGWDGQLANLETALAN